MTTIDKNWQKISDKDAPVQAQGKAMWRKNVDFADLDSLGLLAMINATVFHPRGLALVANDAPLGPGETRFVLYATDGTEAFTFDLATADAKYKAFEALMVSLSKARTA